MAGGLIAVDGHGGRDMDDRSAAPLDEERRRATAHLTAAGAELDDMRSAGGGGDDEHDPEGSTVAFERARVATVVADAQDRLAAVERALARLAAGDYRRCARCGAPIGEERLAARPTTDRCVRCARV